MNRVLLIPILIIAALSGCVEEELNALDLSTMMVNSGKNLDSYRFVTETAMEFKSIEDSTEISMLILRSRDSGAVNLTAQNMSAKEPIEITTPTPAGIAAATTLGQRRPSSFARMVMASPVEGQAET